MIAAAHPHTPAPHHQICRNEPNPPPVPFESARMRGPIITTKKPDLTTQLPHLTTE